MRRSTTACILTMSLAAVTRVTGCSQGSGSDVMDDALEVSDTLRSSQGEQGFLQDPRPGRGSESIWFAPIAGDGDVSVTCLTSGPLTISIDREVVVDEEACEAGTTIGAGVTESSDDVMVTIERDDDGYWVSAIMNAPAQA